MIAAANGTGALINVITNYFFIPEYGAKGAVWCSVISMQLGLYLILLCTAPGRKILKTIVISILTLPSFKLDKNQNSGT